MRIHILTSLLLISISKSIFAQVMPLITTSWNQGCNYNFACPMIAGGACGKAYTGCYATGLAQVLKYHSHPSSPWGGNYTNSGNPVQTVDFGPVTYTYSLMPNSISGVNSEISKLIYHTGMVNDMNYSNSNSTSFFNTLPLLKFFKYSLSTRTVLSSAFTALAWQNLLKSELDAGRVVFVKGGAHFYLIDGYNIANQFHCNFGWGGIYDGYYPITNVSAGGNSYTPNVAMIGIKPLTDIELSGGNASDTITIGANGGLVMYKLSSLSNWTLSSSEIWFTPTATSGAEGYSDLTGSIGINATYIARFANLIASDGVNTRTLVVKQNGITPTLSVSPSSLTFSGGGGMQSSTINSDSNWVATTSDGWITVSPPNGSMLGSIDIITSPNGLSPRFGNVSISRGSITQNITIFQAASGTFWCNPVMNISANSWGITQVNLNTINRISPFNEGYVLTNDTTILKRDSTYTLAVTFVGSNAPAVWIDWNIDGDFSDAGEAIMAGSGTWYPTFNATKIVAFTVPSNAVEGITRMRIYAKDFGTGPISGPCNLSDNGGDIEDYNIITRDHNHISVSPNVINFSNSINLQSISIECDSNWMATTNATWININPTSGVGNGNNNISVSANSSLTSRSEIVTYQRGNKTKTVSINQTGADTSLTISTANLAFTNIGGISNFEVYSNVAYSLTASEPWIILSDFNGNGDQLFTVNSSTNLTNMVRTAFITVTSGSYTQILSINQAATNNTFIVSPTILNFIAAGESQSLIITTDNSWFATVSDSWSSINNNSGTGNSSLLVTAEPNVDVSPRSSELILNDGIHSETVIINQDGLFNSLTEPSLIRLKVFPNPSSGQIFINATKLKGEQLEKLELKNSIGQIIEVIDLKRLTDVDGQFSIDLKAMNGIYFYTIELSDKEMVSGKLILSR